MEKEYIILPKMDLTFLHDISTVIAIFLIGIPLLLILILTYPHWTLKELIGSIILVIIMIFIIKYHLFGIID